MLDCSQNMTKLPPPPITPINRGRASKEQAIPQYCVIDKVSGETPLQALHKLRIEQPKLAKMKLSYAGRLDPLAEGQMLVLIGDECKNKQKYLDLNKTYQVDVLFGISTDTGDVLGKIKHIFCPVDIDIPEFSRVVKDTLASFIGKREQSYPTYSSRNIKKILKGEKPEAKQNNITMYSAHIEKVFTIGSEKLQNDIIINIGKVVGEFRQKEILADWISFFEKNNRKEFVAAHLTVHCSSGTYMRVLAEEIGLKLGLPALALHIKREKIHI